MSATSASRLRVRRLNSVDLPTFGRPTSAMVGVIITARPAASTARQTDALQRFHGNHVYAAVHGLHQDVLPEAQRPCLDATSIGGQPHREAAIIAIEKMDVTLEVADGDEQADLYRRTGLTREQLLLFTDGRTAVLVHREDVA